MVLIHEKITSQNIAGYYIEASNGLETKVGEKVFPATKQAGITLENVKGGAGRPVVLKAAAFDSKATLRDRPNVEITRMQMPLFREALLVKEEDIIRLNELSGNPKLQETVINRIFKDDAQLINAAQARLEAMRMEVLATGKIAVKSNGEMKDFDYGLETEQTKTVKTSWSEAKATPLEDFENALEEVSLRGYKAEVVYINVKTFNELKNHANTIAVYDPTNKKRLSGAKFKDYLKEEFGLSQIVVVEETYMTEDGQRRYYFPEGYVTFAPNAILGETVFGTTPEESNLMAGNQANVTVVGEGIAVTTVQHVNPVNTETIVSMIALPSFDALESIYILDTNPTA